MSHICMQPIVWLHLLQPDCDAFFSTSLQLLTWLVQELLTSGAADLGELLAVYCMERRNPLSSVAGVERVLVRVSDHA